jgi:hypothetical protein
MVMFIVIGFPVANGGLLYGKLFEHPPRWFNQTQFDTDASYYIKFFGQYSTILQQRFYYRCIFVMQ